MGRSSRKFGVVSALSLIVIALLVIAGCSGKAALGPVASTQSAVVDTDGDRLPDHIEKQLGTDAEHFDSDGDGLSDYHELTFDTGAGAGESSRSSSPFEVESARAEEAGWKSIATGSPPDSDGDGVHNALDPYESMEATLTSEVVGFIHTAISKANGWDWGAGGTPSAAEYNSAFVALMQDAENTPAPLIDEGQRVTAPDSGAPLTEARAKGAWFGLAYQASVPVFVLDDRAHGGDEDGIPNGYESYGCSWDGSSIQPWGFTSKGKSRYRPPHVAFVVVGNEFARKDSSELDYTRQYFKSDPTQFTSDADPYSDYWEITRSNMPQNITSPADRPGVAAYPSITGYLRSVKVTLQTTITTKRGGTAASGQVSGSSGSGDPLPGLSISKLLMGTHRPSTGGEATALDFVDNKAVSVAIAAISDDPAAAVTPDLTQINAGFKMNSSDWSEVTTVRTDKAATLTLGVMLRNTGLASADNFTPTIEVFIGDETLGTYTPKKPVLELSVGETFQLDVADAIEVSLDQLKSLQSGAPVSIKITQVAAQVSVPKRDGDAITYVSEGDWSLYRQGIENECARITVDLGNGKFATYPVMAKTQNGPPVSVLDGLLWALGEYEDGQYKRLAVPSFLPDGSASQKVPSFADWLVVFDSHYSEGELADAGSIFNVGLKPGTHIYVAAPGSDRPAVRWASVSPDDGYEITEGVAKTVHADVDADMAIGDVHFALNPSAPRSQWVTMTPDDTGIYTVNLSKASRVVAGQPVVIVESGAVFGDGSAGRVTVQKPAGATAYTGHKGTFVRTITDFDSQDLKSKQIVAYDIDGPKSTVLPHDDWNSPPAGTDLSIWLYSKIVSHVEPSTHDTFNTIAYVGFIECYDPRSGPAVSFRDTSWFDPKQHKSLAAVMAAAKAGKGDWGTPQKGIRELPTGAPWKVGDTILLRSGGGHWAKVAIADISYDSTNISGAGNAKSLKSITSNYVVYDPNQ